MLHKLTWTFSAAIRIPGDRDERRSTGEHGSAGVSSDSSLVLSTKLTTLPDWSGGCPLRQTNTRSWLNKFLHSPVTSRNDRHNWLIELDPTQHKIASCGTDGRRISNYQGLMTLTLTLGHTVYRCASLIDLYPRTKFHWNWRNVLWMDGQTFETHFITSTQRSWPKNRSFWRHSSQPISWLSIEETKPKHNKSKQYKNKMI